MAEIHQAELWPDAAKLTIVTGHFGSGKTEFAINLALRIAELGHKTALADLDIVDPYFRSRERRTLLESRSIQLICSSENCANADLPSMPPDVRRLFDDPDLYGVMDIGGDASGAKVLARYRSRIKTCPHRMLCVINANRPLTDTPEKAEAYLKSISDTCGLPIDGLVNNTHLCSETVPGDIVKGAELVNALSARTGIPVICHMSEQRFCNELEKEIAPLFPVNIYMKKPWEQE